MMDIRKLRSFFFICGILGVVATAGAQDFYVTGSDSLLGNWDYLQGLLLVDDGVPPDEANGDDIFTASVIFEFAAPCTIDYKVTDGLTWIGSAPGTNMQLRFDSLDVPFSQPVVFYFDRRDLTGDDWYPGIDYISDSFNADHDWVAVGDFQTEAGEVGDWLPDSEVTWMHDDGAAGDKTAGDGIHTFQFKPSESLPYAEWKVVRYGPWEGATKFGSDGWSFDPEDSFNGFWAAEPYNLVRLEFDAGNGHIRNTVLPVIECTSFMLDPSEAYPGETVYAHMVIVNWNYVAEEADLWMDVTLPSGGSYPGNPFAGPVHYRFGPSFALEYSYRIDIPGMAPPGGPYTLTLKIGEYPDTVWHEASDELMIIE